jgi:thermitase
MAVSRRQIGVLLVSLVGALALLASSPAAQSVDAAVDHSTPYAAGELLVTFEEEASDIAVESLDEEAGAEVEETLPEIDTRLLEFPEVKGERSEQAREQDLARIKEELEREPAVESVEYNYFYSASYTPNDPRFGEQWGLIKTRFEDAWSSTLGSGVRIAIVDTGAAVGHPDLEGNIASQYDFRNDDGTAEDPNGHGTHVAGIAAAMTRNGRGVAGGCPKCKLLIAKVLGSDGVGGAADIAEGIIWSADKGAKVINVSIGGEHNADTLKKAIAYATRKGAVVVAAAGNDRTSTPQYPAAYPAVIAVAATNQDDRRASFSNYGDWVDVAAPGVGVLSTVPSSYDSFSGTSVAAPHVSALAGLLASQGLGPAGIEKRIFSTAVDLGRAGRDPYYGRGRIDAGRAVR